MTKKQIHIFPDTNLFIQCLDLQQINWSKLGEYQEINLIITNPVIKELDRHKSSGNTRRAKRARKINTILGEILDGDSDSIIIQNANPLIHISVNVLLKPSGELEDELDYSSSDDQIIGNIYSFIEKYPDKDVALLTHDFALLLKAKEFKIAHFKIPKEWLLSPEPDAKDKTIVTLKKEIKELKALQPEFCIKFFDHKNSEIEKLSATRELLNPIQDKVIPQLIKNLKEKVPLKTNFSIKATDKILVAFANVIEPHEREIESYNEKYLEWIKGCEVFFQNLHESYNRSSKLDFCFEIENIGNKPSNDTLITITAKGDFEILPYCEDEDKLYSYSSPKLPAPPSPPEPRILKAFGMLEGLQRPFTGAYHDRPLYNNKQDDDPNAFYYKPRKPYGMPVNEYSLECKQWRHKSDKEIFSGYLFSHSTQAKLSGAIKITIQAENLQEPEEKTIPIKIKNIWNNGEDYAKSLIEELCPPKSFEGM